MKCDENGGCPLLFDSNVCVALDDWAFYGIENPNCHLTSASFPIIKGMIADRFSCRYCTQGHLRNEGTEYECVLCDVLECGLSFPDEHFCEQWTEREKEDF